MKAKKKSAAPASATNGASTSVFVRTLPNATVAEIVIAAKKAGITTTAKYVKWVRWYDRSHKSSAAKGAKSPVKASAKPATKTSAKGPVKSPVKASIKTVKAPVKPVSPVPPKASASLASTAAAVRALLSKPAGAGHPANETEFLRAMLHVGLDRSRQLLREFEAMFATSPAVSAKRRG